MADTLLATKITDSVLVMALLTDGHAAQLRLIPLKENGQEQQQSLVGNIYIGKVRRVQKNINAAFIEIADRQQCYYSLEGHPQPFYTKKGNSLRMIEGDELVVQVKRDGLKTKLPAVSSDLEFAGRYLILTINDKRLGISAKISKEARERLHEWIQPLLSPEYGFIVRTNAAEAAKDEILQEAAELVKSYEHLKKTAPYRTCFSMLKSPLPAWLEMLRDTYTAELTDIITDLPQIHASMEEYLKEHQPALLGRLRFYEDDLLPLAKLFRLEQELEGAVKEHVWLKSGGYLVIQPTEALTVIDVNTGKYSEKKVRRETLRKINLEAAAESARQIRLRNLSGIILIDFINMEVEKDKEELLQYLEKLLHKDPVKARFVDFTKLELVEITRRKVHKSLYEQMASCGFMRILPTK